MNNNEPRIYPRMNGDLRILAEIVCPAIDHTPLGREDALTDYLYGEMIAEQSAEPARQLVDIAGQNVFPDYPDDEPSQLAVSRTLAVLKDMPPQIGDNVKLGAWKHFLRQDWAFTFEYPAGAISETLQDVAKTSPILVVQIRQSMRAIVAAKNMAVSLTSQSKLLSVDPENLDTSALLEQFLHPTEIAPDVRHKYLSAIALARIVNDLTPEVA